MKTGAYSISDGYGLDSQAVLERADCIDELFCDADSLLIEPAMYLNGACDVFAVWAAQEHGYGIRAYYGTGTCGNTRLLHAVCFDDGMSHWIDVRGVTDNEEEMLRPFAEEMRQWMEAGWELSSRDYPRNTCGVRAFIDDFSPGRDDWGPLLDEVRNLSSLARQKMYEVL